MREVDYKDYLLVDGRQWLMTAHGVEIARGTPRGGFTSRRGTLPAVMMDHHQCATHHYTNYATHHNIHNQLDSAYLPLLYCISTMNSFNKKIHSMIHFNFKLIPHRRLFLDKGFRGLTIG